MNEQLLHLLPIGTTKIDDERWRLLAEVDGVPVPITFEAHDDALLVHTTISGLPVGDMAGALLELNRVLRRVRIGALDSLVTVWADLDLEGTVDQRVMQATLEALTAATSRVLRLGGRALGGPEARLAAT